MTVSETMVERAAKSIFEDAIGLSKWDNEFYAEERAGCLRSARKVLTAALSDQVVVPTPAKLNSACLSFRHDFGLLNDAERDAVKFEATEWLRAWQKEGFGADRNEIIEECARVVDLCNREGPYNAIGAGPRIRALKVAAATSPSSTAGEE